MPIARLQPVESRQLHAIGYDPETQTLAIRFKSWKGEPTSLYHYSNVSQADYDALMAAESKGGHFNAHIKAFPDRYPYQRIESAPRAGDALAA